MVLLLTRDAGTLDPSQVECFHLLTVNSRRSEQGAEKMRQRSSKGICLLHP